MQIDAVLFDLFGTLLLLENDEACYDPCLRRVYAFLERSRIDVSFEDFRRVYFGARDKLYCETRETLEEPHFNVRISQTLKNLGYDMDVSHPTVTGATMAFASEFKRHVRLDKNARNVLKKLHERYKLGLVSNFSISECVRELLEEFALERFFDAIVISGDVNRRKPSPEVFKKALEALRVEASRVVFVGDVPDLDIKGPQKLGMKTILIERKRLRRQADVQPDKIIRSLNELTTAVEDC